VSKFAGKFRKNKSYDEDYGYEHNKKRGHSSEVRKMLEKAMEEDYLDNDDYLDQYRDKVLHKRNSA
jgi:hypothetical protein